jgi:hypothetical protein
MATRNVSGLTVGEVLHTNNIYRSACKVRKACEREDQVLFPKFQAQDNLENNDPRIAPPKPGYYP